MFSLRRIIRRLCRLFQRRRVEDEMAEEMRYHLEERADDLAEDGLSGEEARYAAQRRFGNIASIQEQARDVQRWSWLENAGQDLRFAARHLRQSPGFTAVAVLTLALGIGANTAIFSVINSIWLRPLAYADSERLMQIWSHSPEIGLYPVSTGLRFKQWREHATTVDVAAIQLSVALNLIEQGKAERVMGAEVSANYLDVFGVRPWRGRGFQPGDDVAGGDCRVVILTYEWWQGRMGADPSVLHRTINLNQESYTVVGILPPRALIHDDVQFLVPMVVEEPAWRLHPHIPWLMAFVRLRPDVTVAQATAELDAITTELEARVVPERPFPGHRLEPLQTLVVGQSRPTFLMLLGAVVLVLLIVCVNIANLLLARGTTRQKELAVRAALGASAGRIVRQMLTEHLALALLGGLLGVAVAVAGVHILNHVTASEIPALLRPAVDWRLLAWSLLVAGGAGLLFGLLPARQAGRVDVQRSLKDEGDGSTSRSRSRIQSGLVIAEVALTVVLLIGAGLLLWSFARVMRTDPGFAAEQALVCDVSLVKSKFPHDSAVLQFHHQLVANIRSLPGVAAVGTTTTLPLTRTRWGTTVGLAELPRSEHALGAGMDFVGGDYFAAMGMRALQGRLLEPSDQQPGAPRVVIISRNLADALMPGSDPLGRRIHFDGEDWEIIGVVADVRYRQIDAPPEPRVYAAHALKPWDLCLVVRTSLSPVGLIPDIQRAAAEIDAEQSLANFRTLDEAVGHSLRGRRSAVYLIGGFAVLAVALACLGVYGVMSYTLAQRERELAIRTALGADRNTILRLVLRDGMRLTLIGLAVGLLGGAVGARLIANGLYQVGPYDPLVFGGAALAITTFMLVAILSPARHAARDDVWRCLRAG